MKKQLLSIFTIVLFLTSTNVFSQWLDFDDQTANRIIISTISDNDDPNVVDDMEKDFLVADFDNDSFQDLVVVRKNPFSFEGAKTDLLLLNNGNGVLEDKTDILAPEFLTDPTDARDAITIDANGDGWMDIFIVNTFQDQPKLYINRGDDTNGDWLGLEDQSDSRLPTLTIDVIQFCAAISGDLTGDGNPDIYMVNYSQTGPVLDVLYINDGNGNFTEEAQSRMGNMRTSSFGTATELHDVDNDGDLDIIKCLGVGGGAVAPFNDQGLFTMFNNGDGTFTDFQRFPGQAPYMFTGSDLDDDGDLDFYVVDDFQDYVAYSGTIQVDQNVDYNQQLLTSDRTDVWGGNVKMVDLDGDGDDDVTIASVDTDEPPCDTSEDNGQAGGVRTFTLFENEGVFSGNIIDPYAGQDNAWNIGNYDQDFIDINNDGLLDIILGGCEGYVIFVQEETLATDDVVSIDETIAIYPNPSNGFMNVHINDVQSETVMIDVYTVTGRLLTSFSRSTNLSNTQLFDIDLGTKASNGIYFLKFTTDIGTTTRKIVVE
ncbi:MAG: hypothetical protein ACI9Y7_000019 [Dokdonia sp.]|jgi:hypothetical protein